MTDDSIFEVEISNDDFTTKEGHVRLVKKNFKSRGSIWQVHKYDADPFPSLPHAHCSEGMWQGYKLHLGTREIFSGAKRTDFKLKKKEFSILCNLINEHFEEFSLPLGC